MRLAIESARAFLNAAAESLGDTVTVREVFVLHSEPALEIHEEVLVGATGTLGDSPLLRDYLRLFGRVIPPEVAEDYIGPLIEDAFKRAPEDPDGVEREIEALTEAYPHPESYLRLLKFYRLRRSKPLKKLGAAKRYWDLSGRADDDLLWEVVSTVDTVTTNSSPWVDFVRAVWTSREKVDSRIGRWLVMALSPAKQSGVVYSIIRRLIESPEVTLDAIVVSIDALRMLERPVEALAVVEQHKSALASNEDFQAAWTRLIIDNRDPEAARVVLEDQDFRPSVVLAQDPESWMSLQERAGMGDQAWQTLKSQLPALLKARKAPFDRMIARLYEASGRVDEFRDLANPVLGHNATEKLINELPRRMVLGRAR